MDLLLTTQQLVFNHCDLRREGGREREWGREGEGEMEGRGEMEGEEGERVSV